MYFALILVLICVGLLTPTVQIIMKSGMSHVGEISNVRQLVNPSTLFRLFINPYVLTGLFLSGIALVLWLSAMTTLDISLMYPLSSLSYVIVAIAALIFLKEDITLIRWGGIFMVVGGCFLISRTG